MRKLIKKFTHRKLSLCMYFNSNYMCYISNVVLSAYMGFIKSYMKYDEISYLKWVYDNAYPNLMYLFIFILAVLVQFTFSGHVTKKENLGVWDHIVMHFRQKLLVGYILLFICFNIYTIIVANKQLGREDAIEFIKTIYENLGHELFTVSSIVSLITVFIIPYFFHMLQKRYISPKISAFRRKFRVSQTGDSLSDIRIEKDKFVSKEFDNREYYKDGFMFMGLDENEDPIYLSDDEFKSKNLKILGATQTGKGVIQQVCIDQAIKKGWGVWFFDQKPDDFIYSVMVASCKKWNRSPPVILDLTGESIGIYSPFEYGLKRERLNRFNKVFGLTSKGSDSDYYKAINRQVVTFLSDYWDGTLQHLDKLLKGKDKSIPAEKRQWIMENTVNIQSKLDEWKLLPHLFCEKGKGMNVEDEIAKSSIVYVKSRMDDELIREVTNSLLIEWKDAVVRHKHKNHIYAVLDEAKFVISESVASSLATILSKNANMSLAYQERDDTLNLPDKTLNAEAIKNQIETNTLITISYKASYDTAEWISNNSGSIRKSTTRMEQVETDGFGAEKWSGTRQIGQEEENYISINSILSLQKRVGVFSDNTGLPKYLFTCWIPVEERIELPLRGMEKELNNTNENEKKSSKPEKHKVILNDEHFEYNDRKDTSNPDSINVTLEQQDSFKPEDDPEFIRMLEEQMMMDSMSPSSHNSSPVQSEVLNDDFISNIGKKD